MLQRLIMLAGALAFAAVFAFGLSQGASAASTTTVTTGHSTVHSGPHSDASEENPDEVPDADVDAAEQEIRQQLRDARMKVIREGGKIIVSMGADILFTFDSYQVSNEGQAAAKALARVLVRHKRSTVEVNGYTDTRGSEAYNQTLSENRANAVAQIMEAAGVDPARITPHGFGETNLAVETPDETKEIKNRRVVIVINPGKHGLGHVRGGHRGRHRGHRGGGPQTEQPDQSDESDEGPSDEDQSDEDQ